MIKVLNVYGQKQFAYYNNSCFKEGDCFYARSSEGIPIMIRFDAQGAFVEVRPILDYIDFKYLQWETL